MNGFKLGRFARERFLYPAEAARVDAARRTREDQAQEKKDSLRALSLRRAAELECRHAGDLLAAFGALGVDTALLPRHADWMPLELFDDCTQDALQPAGWADLYTDEAGRLHPLPATVWLRDGEEWKWATGTITDVPTSGPWLFRRANSESAESVPRVRICLAAESKAQFAARFLAAYFHRLVCDARKRRFFYVRSMPLVSLPTVSSARRESLPAASLVGPSAVTSVAFVDAAGEELFQQTTNQLLLEEALRRDPGYWAEAHCLLPLEFEEVRPGGLISLPRHTLSVGDDHLCFPVSFTFSELLKLLCTNALLADEKSLRALQAAEGRLRQIKPALTVEALGSYTLDGLKNYLIGLVAGFGATVKSALRNEIFGALGPLLALPGLSELVEMRVRDRLRALGEQVGEELQRMFAVFASSAVRSPPLFLLSLRLAEKRLLFSDKPERLAEMLCAQLDGIPAALHAIEAGSELGDAQGQSAKVERTSMSFGARFAAEIAACAAPLHAFITALEPHTAAVTGVASTAVLQEMEPLPLPELLALAGRRAALFAALQGRIPAKLSAGLFEVECGGVLTALQQQAAEFEQGVEQLLERRGQAEVSRLSREFKTQKARLSEKPTNMEELQRLADYLHSDFLAYVAELRAQIAGVRGIYRALEARRTYVAGENLAQVWQVCTFPLALLTVRDETLSDLAVARTNLYKAMCGRQQRFDAELDALERELQLFAARPPLAPPEGCARDAGGLLAALDDSVRAAATFNAEEALFGKKPTDYARLGPMRQEFVPIADLWRIVARWQAEQPGWLEADWREFDAVAAHAFVEEAAATLRAIVAALRERAKKELTALAKNAERVMREIDQFSPKIALLRALHDPGVSPQAAAEPLGLSHARTVAAVLPLLELREAAVRSFIAAARRGRDFRQLAEALAAKWRERGVELRPASRAGFQLIAEISALLAELEADIGLLGGDVPEGCAELAAATTAELRELLRAAQCWAEIQQLFFPLRGVFDRDDAAAELPLELSTIRKVDTFYRTFLFSAGRGLAAVLTQRDLPLTIEECLAELRGVKREVDLFLGA